MSVCLTKRKISTVFLLFFWLCLKMFHLRDHLQISLLILVELINWYSLKSSENLLQSTQYWKRHLEIIPKRPGWNLKCDKIVMLGQCTKQLYSFITVCICSMVSDFLYPNMGGVQSQICKICKFLFCFNIYMYIYIYIYIKKDQKFKKRKWK